MTYCTYKTTGKTQFTNVGFSTNDEVSLVLILSYKFDVFTY